MRVILFFCAALMMAAPASADWPIAPTEHYPEDIFFVVERGGDPIGTYRVVFRPDDQGLVVETEVELKVGLGPIVLYRFRYVSEELWRDGDLIRMSAATNDDGEKTSMDLVREGDRLSVTGSGGAYTTDGDVLPTVYWHPDTRNADRLINTITGELNAVTVTPGETIEVRTNGASRQATEHRIRGDLQVDVFYDAAGHWVKSRYKAKGSWIEYICERCGLTP